MATYTKRTRPATAEEEILRRMSEPDYLRKLRQQADEIRYEQECLAAETRHREEAEELRGYIRRAGRRPVCCAPA